MRVTWYGTASLGVEAASGRLLIDPFFPFEGSPTRVPRDAYAGYGTILATHGHFDHIMSLPALLREGSAVVYATKTPVETLKKLHVPDERLAEYAPGDRLELEGMRVEVYQSRHVRYDGAILKRTLLNRRMLRHIGNLPAALYGFLAYPENGETVGLLIEAEGRSLYAMGSLNLAAGAPHPTGMDLLALPYQGASDLLTPALAIIEALRPRAVLLDHWDDAFPPISATVDTSDIEAALSGVLPVYKLQPGGGVEV